MVIDKSKLKNATGGRLTKALFFETTLSDKSSVLFTLKDEDHLGFPSLYRLYMEEEDLTEYNFATKYFSGWEHWKMLCECDWFKPYVERWREEVYLKIAARALIQIKGLAKTGGRDAFQAQRYLIDKGWLPKEDKNKRGRPSNEEIDKAAKEIASDINKVDADLARIGLIN